jgi:lambda family phage tail tape measure protein
MDFASLADSIISDLTRIMIRALIIGPIVKAIGGGGDDGGSGLLGSLMDVIGFEKGGVFNSSPSLSAYSNTVQTSPKYFTYGTLNRFANGGVFAEAGPEAVMPLTKMGNGKLGVHSSGSGGVKIIVNNNGSSAQVAAQDRGTDGNGTRQIEIMITDIVAKSLAVGRLDKAMQGAFNIRRTAT